METTYQPSNGQSDAAIFSTNCAGAASALHQKQLQPKGLRLPQPQRQDRSTATAPVVSLAPAQRPRPWGCLEGIPKLEFFGTGNRWIPFTCAIQIGVVYQIQNKRILCPIALASGSKSGSAAKSRAARTLTRKVTTSNLAI
jgi:hypothetical protein